MSISVLSDLSFQRKILPVSPLETTFLCTFLRVIYLFPSLQTPSLSIDQTSLRNHYKWCNFPGIFVKDSSIFHYKGDVPASIHSKGKIHIVTRGNEHGLTSQHHYWAHKGKTRGRSGSENGKGNKAERTKLYFELLNITPRHCCTCASPLFPFNLSPQGPSEPCKLLTYFAVCTNSWS